MFLRAPLWLSTSLMQNEFNMRVKFNLRVAYELHQNSFRSE